MRERFGLIARTRSLCAFGVVAVSLSSFLVADTKLVLAIMAFALCLVGELLERYLFFRAVGMAFRFQPTERATNPLSVRPAEAGTPYSASL